MDMEHTHMWMEPSMRGFGSMINRMVMALSNGQMAVVMMGSICRARSTVKGSMFGQMVVTTMAIGFATIYLVREHIIGKMVE